MSVISINNHKLEYQCQWYSKQSGMCEFISQSLSLLNTHLTEHITVYLSESTTILPYNELASYASDTGDQMDPAEGMDNITLYNCSWQGCQYQEEDIDLLRIHLYYHAYHLYIKLAGTIYMSEKILPQCRLGCKESSIISKIEQSYCCHWLCSGQICEEK